MARRKQQLSPRSIGILYHSGSGSTRTICEIFYEDLAGEHRVDLLPITSEPMEPERLAEYDYLIIGTPTYHGRPSLTFLEFLDQWPPLPAPVQAFAFTTYGLHPGNNLRYLVERLSSKNLIVASSMELRGPSSDRILFSLHPLPFMYHYEKRASLRIKKALTRIREDLRSEPGRTALPPQHALSRPVEIVQNLLKRRYTSYKASLHLIQERCGGCQICVDHCSRGAWTYGEEYPVFHVEKCEFCLGCVHSCCGNAIVPVERMKDRNRLNRMEYSSYKAELQKK